MYAETPPVNTDLSRSRLKHIATWIRDDLDLQIAREGADILRPDDVLILHETFLALRHATHITALDLRATGIAKAVQDISGVATRWPGRLCDDCDKIIALWTARFGPLNELHPFLYGRGGRLEGIANATEYSKEALLRRWQTSCPEKIHPKRSHRLGDLGFRAGAWWINPLFAYHAGIIGLEAVEGGTTFDKYGAYALVLKDTGEVEASSEEGFTYRVPQKDKGKFRLTAATPKSRDPIRVLRSHSINSVWGPKVGIRYEGLYAVKGWSIRQAKHGDATGGEWNQGDIIFEVRFERKDPVAIEEVRKRPTATEVDDYTEHKRLRRVHRESKRNGATLHSTKGNTHRTAKAAPPITPLQSSPMLGTGTKAPVKDSSNPSTRTTTFKRPHFDIPEDHHAELMEIVSPMTTNLKSSQFSWDKSSKLEVPIQGQSNHDTSSNDQHQLTNTESIASSNNTTTSIASDMREVAPWIDFDAELSLPSYSNETPIVREQIITQAPTALVKKDNVKTPPPTKRNVPSPVSASRSRRESHESKKGTQYLGSPPLKKSDSRKSIFVRSRNPMAKLFDGANDESDDYFGSAARPTIPLGSRRSFSNDSVRVYSPTPVRPFRPESPFAGGKTGFYLLGQ